MAPHADARKAMRAGDHLADQVVHPHGLRSPPQVSVVMPTYRRAATGQLDEAIASVLRQTFRDLEFIVVDDGSTDGTKDVVAAWRRRDDRLMHVRHEANSGLPAVRCNEGIELARGRYVAFQFDDDTWMPDALERLLATAAANPGAVVVGQSRYTFKGHETVVPGRPVTRRRLARENCIANNAVLVPRELLDEVGLYDPHAAMRTLCDYDLWRRLARRAPFALCDHVITSTAQGNADSIGQTVSTDATLFEFIQRTERDALLRPGAWQARLVHEEVRVPALFRARMVVRAAGRGIVRSARGAGARARRALRGFSAPR